MGAISNVTRVKPGDAVAILGTGGIGLNACVAAAFCGAMPLIGVDPNPARRELALRCGATDVIDPTDLDVVTEIGRIVPGGVDVAIEATGNAEVMAVAINVTRMQGGRAVVIGNARVDQQLTLNPGLFNQGKSLLGTWGGDSVPDRDNRRYARLLASGRFPIENLLSKPYRLEEADRAINDLEAGQVGRPLIDMAMR